MGRPQPDDDTFSDSLLLPERAPDGAIVLGHARSKKAKHSTMQTNLVIIMQDPLAYSILATTNRTLTVSFPTTLSKRGTPTPQHSEIRLQPHSKSILGELYHDLYTSTTTHDKFPHLTPLKTTHQQGSTSLTGTRLNKMDWIQSLLADPPLLEEYHQSKTQTPPNSNPTTSQNPTPTPNQPLSLTFSLPSSSQQPTASHLDTDTTHQQQQKPEGPDVEMEDTNTPQQQQSEGPDVEMEDTDTPQHTAAATKEATAAGDTSPTAAAAAPDSANPVEPPENTTAADPPAAAPTAAAPTAAPPAAPTAAAGTTSTAAHGAITAASLAQSIMAAVIHNHPTDPPQPPPDPQQAPPPAPIPTTRADIQEAIDTTTAHLHTLQQEHHNINQKFQKLHTNITKREKSLATSKTKADAEYDMALEALNSTATVHETNTTARRIEQAQKKCQGIEASYVKLQQSVEQKQALAATLHTLNTQIQALQNQKAAQEQQLQEAPADSPLEDLRESELDSSLSGRRRNRDELEDTDTTKHHE